MIDQLLIAVANFMGNLASNLTNYARGLIQSVVGWLNQWVAAIMGHINTLIVTLYNWIQGLFAAIANWIGQMIVNLQNAFAYMVNKIMEYINYALNGVAFIVNNVVAKIQAGIDVFISMVRYWIGELVNWFKGVITQVIDTVRSFAQSIISTVQGWVDRAMQLISAAYDAAIARIQRAIDVLIGAAGALIDRINDRLVQLKTAVVDGINDVLKKLPDAFDHAAGEAIDDLVTRVEQAFTIVDISGHREIVQSFTQLLEGKAGMGNFRQLFSRFGDALFAKNPRIAGLFMTQLLIIGTVGAVMPILQEYGKPIVQEVKYNFPNEVLSPIDAGAAYRRGFISREIAVQVIRKSGYTPEDAGVILELAQNVPDQFDLVAMELRGLISPAETDAALKIRGFDPQWAGRIRAMGQIIPPVADLIVMAVREAFSPDVASRFGQYEDFPEAFAEWAQKQGLSVDWARRYWAAHWSLPSPQQGFEMFQRRIINESDLNLLLRALDIMPFWRDKLTAMAYNPLTRVDVRRMHQLQVLTDDDVYNSYLDIGYSPENAKRLQDFTIKLNKGQAPVNDEELGRLTRVQVLNFYKDGLVTKERTLAMLGEMGIPAEAAVLYVRSIDLDEELAIRKADADFVVEQAQAGLLTFAEAQDKLNNMGLEPLEVKKAINKLVRLLDSKTKLPSRTEGESMWVSGIISEQTYRDLLSLLGYAPHWVNAYVALRKEKEHGAKKS